MSGAKVPLNALFGSDFVTLLVVVEASDTMADVAQKVAAHVVGKRVAARDAELGVYHRDRLVPSDWTVERAEIAPRQFVFVDYLEE